MFAYAMALILIVTIISSASFAQQRESINETLSENASFPVSWFKGFGLYFYIKGEKLAETHDDIKRQLQSKWEDSIEVEGEAGRKRSISSCDEFFKAKEDKLFPISNVNRGPYSILGLYCFAAQLILDAKPAKISYIESLKFDENIAKYLPADVEYRINPRSRRHTSGSWDDVEKVKAVKMRAKEIKYESKDAIHFVRRIAVGDFNSDGIQDVLFIIGHHVKEGTHFENSLYIMTRVNSNNILENIKRYTALED